jgi:hypothetical protein
LVNASLIRKYSLFVPAVVTGTLPSRDGNRSPLEGEPPWQKQQEVRAKRSIENADLIRAVANPAQHST